MNIARPVAACAGLAGLVLGLALLSSHVVEAQRAAAPTFRIDHTWPPEFKDHYILGAITGVFVDAKDHVWITHLPETLTEEETSEVQNPPIATCCRPAPTVLELDTTGKVVGAWGTGSMDDTSNWPRNPHGIFVDHTDHVWIGTYMHHRVQKFTRDGKLVMTIGQCDKTAGSNDTTLLGGPAGIWVDPRPTRCSSPTASTATAASSSSTAPPAPTSGTGAPTASGRTTR